MQSGNMKALLRFTVGVCLFGLFAFSSQAAFTSLYAFGDSVSSTTNNTEPSVAHLYYGQRFSNGRVWVEVLAERQGLAYDPKKNWSYFGHYSSDLLANLNRFPAPPDASTALFVVWVSDADFVWDLNQIDPPYTTNRSLAAWMGAINQSLTNHWKAVQMIYSKGARSLIMPNAVDISKVPYYAYLAAADRTFVRQRVIDFNSGFAALLDQARRSLPGLAIYEPDVFTLLDDMASRPANYGLINPGIDAVDDASLTDKSLNGPGRDYIFWDYLDPTAKVHAWLADTTQQLVCPVYITNLALSDSSNRLDLENVPIGRNGFIQSSSDFSNWATGQSIPSTNRAQTLWIPESGPKQFYRLIFPFSWAWP
jgi:phospholipase/lecithinase/hemolysin